MLRIATRKSILAMVQTNNIAKKIRNLGIEVEILPIISSGDANTNISLAEIGGKGLFCKELEEALLAGKADIAVHSAKDMESFLPDGLGIACILQREDVRDAIILPFGVNYLKSNAKFGTASVRRAAQLKVVYPNLEIVNFRGNVQTRLQKLENGDVDATMLAMAGLNRLNLADKASIILDINDFMPSVAQGAVAIEYRIKDNDIKEILAPLNHKETEFCVSAERAMLAVLDGNCKTPIAGYASFKENKLHIRGKLFLERIYEAECIKKVVNLNEAVNLGEKLGKMICDQQLS